MKENDIITDPLVINRAERLDYVHRRFKKMVSQYQQRKHAFDIFVDSTGESHYKSITPETIIVQFKVRKSLLLDLAALGESELAADIIFYADHKRT